MPSIRHFIALLAFLIIAALFGYFFILPPKVIGLTPDDETKNISLNSSLIIKFDKPIKRQEISPSIYPEIYGEWKFEDPLIKNHLYRTLVFEPAIDFEQNARYEVKLENIKGFGITENTSFNFSFETRKTEAITTATGATAPESKIELKSSSEPEITMLKIPLDWQDHPLSCEAASMKMALGFKGVKVSEEQIMGKIGIDLTPRKNNIWGDPNKIFVGDIDGKMCTTGYGVYWERVAAAAENWRNAQSFSGWTLADLVKEIQAGNPVVIWGTLPVANLHDCSWQTPEGKHIKAYKETHVRLAIGFVGPPENPSKIIINDPLAGRLYWSTSYFLTNWKAFDYSGVVIR